MKLALALALMPMAAFAQDIDCSDPATQSDMTECAAQDWKTADADLNAAYAEAMDIMQSIDSNLDPDLAGAEDALRAAQRAWLTYRDTACTSEGFKWRGGSAEPMVVLSCKARLTEQRTEDLLGLAEEY